jgi:hypothetical protein
MKYMMMFYENEAKVAAQRDQAERAGPYWDAWNAYMGALYPTGIVVGGDALLPPSAATSVRLEDGKRLVQDGPVAATKEQLAGYVAALQPPTGLSKCAPCWICPVRVKRWTAALKTQTKTKGGGLQKTLPAPLMGAFLHILRGNGGTWPQPKTRLPMRSPGRSASGLSKACRPTPMHG